MPLHLPHARYRSVWLVKKRGRPWVYSRVIGAAVAESIANSSSKKQACAEAGVAYSTFMRWQRQKRSLRTLLEEAAQTWRDDKRMECDLKVLLSKKLAEPDVRSHLHDRRPYRDPNAQPVKWMKLIQWWLVHRVSVDKIVTPQIEAAACVRFKIPLAAGCSSAGTHRPQRFWRQHSSSRTRDSGERGCP